MQGLFQELKNRLSAGEDAVLVTVVASSGSTPRGAGARMLVCNEGRVYGTIGGGAVEFQSQKLAQEVLGNRRSTTRGFSLSPGQVADLGMVCGGDVVLYFQYIQADRPGFDAFLDDVLSRFPLPTPCWLITEITDDADWTMTIANKPADLGANAQALASLLKGNAVQLELGQHKYYAEPLVRAGYVYVFGGGHVSQELVRLLSHLSFRCVVYEAMPEFARKSLFPSAAQILVGDFQHIGEKITITKNDYMVIMTRGHQNDFEVQSQALRTDACYIGVIGSRNKIRHVSQRLMELGFTQQDLDRVHTPIGLAIKAETPAEIAVSIAGELIRIRAELASE